MKMYGRSARYLLIDEISKCNNKIFEKCMNIYLKGKKMSNVFNVLAIQEHTDKLPTILVPITTVIAEDESRAKLTFAVENAAELKDKEDVLILARSFC